VLFVVFVVVVLAAQVNVISAGATPDVLHAASAGVTDNVSGAAAEANATVERLASLAAGEKNPIILLQKKSCPTQLN
jgi:hypothetical protein